jgi:hypothetical protein
MCETRIATTSSTSRIASMARVALAACAASACVIHHPGLAVEVWIDVPDAPLALALRATEVSLVPCPGEPVDPTHMHGGDAALALTRDLRTSIAPTPGRYCDLRVQIESDQSVPRQAVLPLACASRPTPLLLGAADRGRVVALSVSGPAPSASALSAQQRIDAWLRGLTVEQADCQVLAAP